MFRHFLYFEEILYYYQKKSELEYNSSAYRISAKKVCKSKRFANFKFFQQDQKHKENVDIHIFHF